MWRVLGWMWVIGLCCATSEAATQESTQARQLTRLGELKLEQGHRAEAVQLFSQALKFSEERLRQEALEIPEPQLKGLLKSLRPEEERLYTLARAYPEDARVVRLAMTAALLRKGRSIEESARLSRALHRGLGAQERDTVERLQALRAQFAQLSLQEPGSLSADDQQRLAEVAAQVDAIEAELVRRTAPLRERNALPLPAGIVDRVAASLPHDSALIEFVAYADRPLVSQDPRELRYLALVLFPDGRLHAVDLGSAKLINDAALKLSNALANKDAAYHPDARSLYALAFQPLRPLLGGTRHIYLALDDQLALVPFYVLEDEQGALIETFEFTYLDSGRELLPRPEELSSSGTMAIFADPTLGSSPHRRLFHQGPMLAERGDWTDTSWLPLPGTRQEAESLQRLFPWAQLFLGADATREQLLHQHAPGILHVATHGFLLDGSKAPEGSRALGHVGTFNGNPSASHLQAPMLRSGLVLSSAEDSAQGAMVTALELGGMDLWGTELVVLSACDTGRGEVEPGQGVYGLRRAFIVAGAETVVMSLWKVNDEATHLLMENYYRNLRAGQGRDEALREAMLALRKIHHHPHDWAPFITLGRDTPLRSLHPER